MISKPIPKKPKHIAKRATRQNKKNTNKPKLPFGVHLLLAFIAGACFSFALAPYKFWALAILSPMALYALLIQLASPKRAFWVGEIYGFGVWLVGAFWLYTSIHEYGNIPAWLAYLMIGVLALIMGLFHAVMAWVFVRFIGRQPLAFASLWVIQEWMKTWFLTGFPWLFVGYAFTEVAWLASFAPVLGVFGVSFLAVLFGASLVEVIRQKINYLYISAGLLFVGVVLHLINPNWTKPTGESLSVSLIQGNIPQEMKWLTEFRYETLQIYASLSRTEWGQDVVVWPEASIPMFQDEADRFLRAIYGEAKKKGSTWITGIPYRDGENFDPAKQEYPNFYNTVMAVGNNQVGLYKKQHLVPFGEYVPFEGMLNILPNLANMQDVASFSRGDDKQVPLMVKGKNMGSAICYEVAYPNTTRKNAKNTEFLLTISNDAWFGTSTGPHQHLQMVQMRSLEMGRWFMRATNTGITAFIDEKGKIVKQAPQFEPAILRHDVPSFVGATPFMRMGNYPILFISMMLILLSFIARKQGAYDSTKQIHYDAMGVQDRQENTQK
ncbi:apolipoprotein N-acyltransferase [Moraxella oblonga]|uniref:apolipoprotein N-acyltransferase n=1 Tax=Moraxella oblonga TaxID=200413 RepID=UPI0009FCE969|nr:apolipoprotein N-acyltransferase [Moraxella oblonga]